MSGDCEGDRCSCGGSGRLSRRELVKAAGLSTVAALLPDLQVMAGPFVSDDFARLIPLDKKLDPAWVASLTARGEPQAYRGRDGRFIGMPVGGLFCGTVYLAGDGRLWLWDIFNRNQNGALGDATASYRGQTLSAGGGAAYVEPGLADDHRVLEQGFSIAVRSPAGTLERSLDATGFSDVAFVGQYPIGTVQYADPAVPLAIQLEAFSPFVPLNTADSSLPVTVLAFRLRSTATEPLEIELTGRLENAVCHGPQYWDGIRRNELVQHAGATILRSSVRPKVGDTASRAEVLFEDWSKPTYDGWAVEGKAFGAGPVARKDIPAYQGDVGGDTERVVNSHASAPGDAVGGRDGATGKLISKPFTISRRFINLWVGGGQHPGRTCVNLLIDGKTVHSEVGRNENRMTPRSISVRQYEGRSAQIEIVDAESGPWGNIGVGRIVLSDRPAGAVEADRQGDFGTMALALLGEPAEISSGSAEAPLEARMVGRLGRRLTLAPGATAEVAFAVAWHFPNVGILPQGRRHYAARFKDAAEVAGYVAEHAVRLIDQTRLWRDTWYDSSLPYWFLDRTFANTSTLATTTCHRFEDGRFWAWEGIGCCAGTCTHVWHYAQAPARLFPELERDQRERVDFGLALQEDGTIRFRAEHGAIFAADGQAGRILGAYREHQMSADDAFLRRCWPKIRLATMRLIAADPRRDGLLLGPLHNTLDADWLGHVPWLCGLYHAALAAARAMATEVGDEPFAAACAAVLKNAAAHLDKACWSEEHGYYVHHGDPAKPTHIGSYDGCHIDQVFGEGWARQVGLHDVMTPVHVKAALGSIWKYNFTPDVGPWREARKAGRWYALAGDGGTIMVTFPFAADRSFAGEGAGTSMYFNECMSGFEHQAASHMMWESLTTEALAVTRVIHDRYSGKLRNPYNEVECSDHYARAMASYGTYVAACGFECHGPKGHLGFAPRVKAEDFRSAFTAAEGWGTYSQQQRGEARRHRVEPKYGQVMIKTLAFDWPADRQVGKLEANMGGRSLEAEATLGAGRWVVMLHEALTLRAGEVLEISATLA